ncbi:arsenic resistance protein [Actinokineospora sp. NPDC004072]
MTLGVVERMEHHQIAIYLAAMAVGGLLGWTLPAAGPGLAHAINPVLGALLYVTFLQVPAAELLRSLHDGRFLSATLAVNFLLVPAVVVAIVVFLPADQAVRIGVLLVLLTPCVDYVIVFCGLAGGSSRRLLAATPLLLIAQMLRCRCCSTCSWARSWPTSSSPGRSSRRSSCSSWARWRWPGPPRHGPPAHPRVGLCPQRRAPQWCR